LNGPSQKIPTSRNHDEGQAAINSLKYNSSVSFPNPSSHDIVSILNNNIYSNVQETFERKKMIKNITNKRSPTSFDDRDRHYLASIHK
jgi:hypothetical protein